MLLFRRPRGRFLGGSLVKSSDAAVKSAEALTRTSQNAEENYRLAKEALIAQIQAFNDSKDQFDKYDSGEVPVVKAVIVR